MEGLTDALKVLFEKRFMPTVIGIVAGISAYALTPETNGLLQKLGRNWYVALFAGIAIIVVSLIQYIIKCLPKWKNHREVCRKNQEYDLKEEKERVQDLWDYIDGLSVREREIIELFLENGNTPQVLNRYSYQIEYGRSIFDNPKLMKEHTILDDKGFQTTEYVLGESFYKELLYILNKYGRISNFKEDLKND